MFTWLCLEWIFMFKVPRKTWVLQWPGQVVICVSSIYWTEEVSEAITKGTLQVRFSSTILLIKTNLLFCTSAFPHMFVVPLSSKNFYIALCWGWWRPVLFNTSWRSYSAYSITKFLPDHFFSLARFLWMATHL